MVTNILRTVLTALIGLWLVPFYLDEIGLDAYAIIPLATSVTSYVMILSDALTNAFSRYLVIALQEGDIPKANRTYSTTLYGFGKILLMMLPLVVIISVLSPYVFQVGSSSVSSVQMMFLMVLSSAVLVSFSSCYNSVFMAFNKLYMMYICRIVYILMQVFLVVAFFFAEGPRLEYIGVSYVISSLVFFVLLMVIAKRICPSLKVKRNLHDKALLREMSGLGAWSILSKFGTLMFIQASIILVNIYVGAAAQSGFSIVASIISMVSTACFSITATLAPLIYLAYSKKDKENMLRIVKVAMRFVTLLLAFPVAYICIFSPQILTVWVGGEFAGLSDIIFLMFLVQVGVCAIDVLESVPIIMMKIKPVALVTICIGVFNVALSIVLLTYTDMGMTGVAIAWTMSMFILNFIFIPLYNARILLMPWYTFLKPIVPGFTAFVICLAIGFTISWLYVLPSTWLAVLGSFFIGFSVYSVLALALGLSREDKQTIRSVMPNFLKRLIPERIL